MLRKFYLKIFKSTVHPINVSCLLQVVDMRTVLEVVSVLEDFPVTKETLGVGTQLN